ncbi:MAG: NAD(P)-dependent oxidoreductase [Alphaproteobacteria bacterium]|nr:MAG: NAD(P)-dependent oxidoreductase [Alphaproteobacteria bacterium]
MATLFCFGLGYSAQHFIAEFGARFDRIAGTVTTREKAAAIANAGVGGHRVEAFVFDGTDVSPQVTAALMDAAALLISVPPGERDPVLAQCGDTIAGAPQLQSIVYLSTIGVYGDHRGAWVDETTVPAPLSERSRERLAAEAAWAALGARAEKPVAILRLSGIYGPGQNALVQVARGSARRIDKPDQVFNRIHVADIAQAIDAASAQRVDGVFNVTDDEPTPQGVPIAFAAGLLGVAPPPETPFVEAARTMSPMALSFYGESKRVRNDRLQRELGVTLRYPTYREGLRALFAGCAAGLNAMNTR